MRRLAPTLLALALLGLALFVALLLGLAGGQLGINVLGGLAPEAGLGLGELGERQREGIAQALGPGRLVGLHHDVADLGVGGAVP